MQAVDKRAVLAGDLLAVQRARLERVDVDAVDVIRDRLPPLHERIGLVVLLRVDGKVLVHGRRPALPEAQPDPVAPRRIAAQSPHAVVLGRPHLPTAAVRVLDDDALHVVLEAPIPVGNRLEQAAPRGHAAHNGRRNERRPRQRVGRPRKLHDTRGVHAHRLDGIDARAAHLADDAVLGVLQDPRVGQRLVEGIGVHTARAQRAPEHGRKRGRLAVVAAVGVQGRARVNAPAVVVLVPEHANHHAVEKLLDGIVARRRRAVRHALAVRRLPRRHADGAVLERVPDDGAEGAHVRLGHVRNALDVADQRKGACRAAGILDAQRPALGAAQKGGQTGPRGMRANEVGVNLLAEHERRRSGDGGSSGARRNGGRRCGGHFVRREGKF